MGFLGKLSIPDHLMHNYKLLVEKCTTDNREVTCYRRKLKKKIFSKSRSLSKITSPFYAIVCSLLGLQNQARGSSVTLACLNPVKKTL